MSPSCWNTGADPQLRTEADADHPHMTPLELAKKLNHRKIVDLLNQASGTAIQVSKKSSKAASATDAWAEAKAFLKEHHPDLMKSLRKGTTQEKLGDLEESLGQTLPEDFKEFYLLSDGQQSGADPLVPPRYRRWLPPSAT